MAGLDLENIRNNKTEAKIVLRKSIFSFLISLVGISLFTYTLNKSKLGEATTVSISDITFIVICFCLILYSGFLATRNLLLGIRELIISKDKFNYIAVIICSFTIIGTITLVAIKALSITDF